MTESDEEFVDKCPPKKYPDCIKCKTKEHTEEYHTMMKKREYMRVYLYIYREGSVAYRRKPAPVKKSEF
jgi:hypothetical protein